MKKLFVLLLALTSINLFAQNSLTKEAQPIVEEGKLLYKSEMASWYGTDIFLEKYQNKDKIGGYFSYSDQNISKCIFFSSEQNPKVIGTISFDTSYSTKTATVDLTERDFSRYEYDLYTIRTRALEKMNSDTLFKFYQNTDLNLIPLITKNEKKVYVLTGPKQNGVVIFGNDYLITFDSNNNLITAKKLHKNIIPINANNKTVDGVQVDATVHSHSAETGDFITATDVCTLMLYSKFTSWKTHKVVSEKYLNIWNCTTNELSVVPMDTIRKINEMEEKRKNK